MNYTPKHLRDERHQIIGNSFGIFTNSSWMMCANRIKVAKSHNFPVIIWQSDVTQNVLNKQFRAGKKTPLSLVKNIDTNRIIRDKLAKTSAKWVFVIITAASSSEVFLTLLWARSTQTSAVSSWRLRHFQIIWKANPYTRGLHVPVITMRC